MQRGKKRTATRTDHPQEWSDVVAEFEERIGTKLSDLEAGDKLATKIAQRNLRKEFMRLTSRDAEGRNT